MVGATRATFVSLSDAQLLAQCNVDTYRASGPGGQKRNKTSSAVRLRHPGSGLIVIAEESRSQHENRARALRRMRQAFYIKIREPVTTLLAPAAFLDEHPEYRACRTAEGRLIVGRKDARFWPVAALVLDVVLACTARVSEASAILGISTANLIEFLALEPKVWEQVGQMRSQFHQKPLRMD